MSLSSKQKTVNKGPRALCECVCERQQLAARFPEQPLMWAVNEGQKLSLCCSFTSAEFYLSDSFIELSKGKGISQSHSLTETGQVLFGDKLLALNYNIPHLLTFILLRSWNSIESLDFGSLQHFESFLFLSFCLRFAAVVENLNYWVLLIESKVRQKNNSDTTWTSETNLSLNFFK